MHIKNVICDYYMTKEEEDDDEDLRFYCNYIIINVKTTHISII